MDSPCKKPHAILLPFPAQGHINPFMQLAKLLHSNGFHITFINTEFNHRRFVRSKGQDFVHGLRDFRFQTIPDGLPLSERDSTQEVWALCDSLRKNCLGPFRELLIEINSEPGSPPVTCVISDGAMSFAIKAAEELGIPEVQFWTASACGLMGYLQYGELIKRGIVPFKDNFAGDGILDTSIDWIPGLRNMRLKDIPSFIRTTNRDDIMLNFMKDEAENCLKSNTIIFNTFDDLEPEVLEAITDQFPHIYTIGPLSLLQTHIPATQAAGSIRSNLWKEDWRCLEWLDGREPSSVLYVNYGCIAVMSEQHFKEFAWGIANSKHPFLWIVRPDAVKGNFEIILPEEYFEEIKDRGLLTTWCPQDQVLSHPSVGAFLTHCGWNSTLESMSGGVPVLCWPFFGEQPTNCRYLCTVWGIGLEVNDEIKREEIEALVKEVMETENGKEMRQKAMELRKKAEEATDIGGSSYNNLYRLIKEVLLSKYDQKSIYLQK